MFKLDTNVAKCVGGQLVPLAPQHQAGLRGASLEVKLDIQSLFKLLLSFTVGTNSNAAAAGVGTAPFARGARAGGLLEHILGNLVRHHLDALAVARRTKVGLFVGKTRVGARGTKDGAMNRFFFTHTRINIGERT